MIVGENTTRVIKFFRFKLVYKRILFRNVTNFTEIKNNPNIVESWIVIMKIIWLTTSITYETP